MSRNATNMYDVEPHIAEIYDRTDKDTEDVALLRTLIGRREPLRVLEPFCGTGRILIPLALDGHTVVGLDQARGMLDRAQAKISRLPPGVQGRISLVEADVTADEWPRGFALLILGGNCLYELATPAEQEGCIRSAAASLNLGGHIFIDNDHMEGDLDVSWRRTGVRHGFPTGVCGDGTRVESTAETIWWNAARRLVRFRRSTKVTFPDGAFVQKEFLQQKHPVSAAEVRGWLETHGFAVREEYGDHSASPYADASERAVFWAERR